MPCAPSNRMRSASRAAWRASCRADVAQQRREAAAALAQLVDGAVDVDGRRPSSSSQLAVVLSRAARASLLPRRPRGPAAGGDASAAALRLVS